MIVPLHGDQRVACVVLGGDEPRQVRAAAGAADREPLPLAQRVVGEAVMAADDPALGRLDRARGPRQVARQEVAERPLADEADARRVLLRPGRDALAPGDRPDLALGHLAQRKQHRRQLLLRQLVQEVALVLGRVDRLQQLDAGGGRPHAGVVARRDVVRAQRAGVIEERAELDLAVAQHVRVRRAAGLVLAQEVREHALAILGGEVDRLELDADDVRHRRRVDEVRARRAVLLGVVVLPVLHEDADDVAALLLQQPRGDRRVDAARHADDHPRTARHQGWSFTNAGAEKEKGRGLATPAFRCGRG